MRAGEESKGRVSNSSYICHVYTDGIGSKLLAFGIWYFFLLGGGVNSPPGGQMQNSRNIIFSTIKPRKDTAGRQTNKTKQKSLGIPISEDRRLCLHTNNAEEKHS